MKAVFFKVEHTLNIPKSEARAPDGTMGVAEPELRVFKKFVQDRNAQIILYGNWKKDWNFNDALCTPNGVYLNKKLNRKGLHILDKTADKDTQAEEIEDWVKRHPSVTEYSVYIGPESEWVKA